MNNKIKEFNEFKNFFNDSFNGHEFYAPWNLNDINKFINSLTPAVREALNALDSDFFTHLVNISQDYEN